MDLRTNLKMEKLKRPKILNSITPEVMTGCGKMYVRISEFEGKPFEIFATLGKAGCCPACYGEAVSRCISLGLRYGIPITEFIEQLEGLSCPSPALEEGTKVMSCADGIAKAMKLC